MKPNHQIQFSVIKKGIGQEVVTHPLYPTDTEPLIYGIIIIKEKE